MAWATENLEHEPQVRTMLFATPTVFAYVMNAFIPIAAFPAAEAPNWKIGSKLYLGFTIIATLMFFAIHYGLRWEARKKAKNVHDNKRDKEPDNSNKNHEIDCGEKGSLALENQIL